MERESWLRSLPYFHPSSWPTPASPSASARNHGAGGACVRKLIFPRHVVSIEPTPSDDNTRDAASSLGPAFFGVTNDVSTDGTDAVNKAVLVNGKEDGTCTRRSRGQGCFPPIDRDPALCAFEASVLMPRSSLAAGASPGGASSTSTDIAYSRSPTAPAARKAAAATPAARRVAASSSSGLTGTGTTKQAAGMATDPEPVLYFQFGGDGTYCVDHGRILNIALETGGYANAASDDGRDEHGDEGQGGQGDGNVVGRRDETNQRATRSSVPPNVVISFDACSFRIFDLEQTRPREEQLQNLRSMVNELAASLRAAGSTFAPPPTTEENSMDKDKGDSGDTQSTCGRASLEEGGQRGIELESSGSSEVKGHSEAKDEDEDDAGRDDDKEGSSDPTTDGGARRVSEITITSGPSNGGDEPAKRRRRAYDRSVAATERVASLADPLRPFPSTRGAGLGFGPAAAEEQISMLMTAAANALTAAYDAVDDGGRSDDAPDEVDRVRASLDGTMAEFFPVHARTKHQRRGGSLSLSMSMASPSGQSPSVASAAAPLGDPSRDADDLRNDARRMMKEYREAIIARHRSAILPSR